MAASEHHRGAGVRADGRLAVVDIGSNTVRLVVFEGASRVPVPLFNEKVVCGLGRGLDASGRLDPEGTILAREALRRFSRLTEAMQVARVDLLATAAVRDASDGPDFATWVERLFGRPVQVLTGAEEAKLSAHGVLCGFPEADGLVGDLGGGSLDLVGLDKGRFTEVATLPLGHLRVAEVSGGDAVRAAKHINTHLAGLTWLGQTGGETLYVVGGAWRAVGRLFIEHTGYPLHILDNYVIARYEAENLLDLIAGLSRSSLEKIRRISRRRVDSLPFAALVMREVLRIARPRRVAFSGYGMREGQFLKSLDETIRAEDPLLSACAHFASQRSRFGDQGQEIFDWLSPLFPDEPAEHSRIRMAVCLLSDIAWSEHPDYRATHAFQRVLRLPFAGLSHRNRAIMALAVALRHQSERNVDNLAPVLKLLNEEAETRARTLGAGLRLGYTLSGGVPGLLSTVRLRRDEGALYLTLPGDGATFTSEVVQRRLQSLARALNVEGVVEAGAARAAEQPA
jgi:exopolyphosphatase/guanosine-5'-triphosphate,3'-diphosphate pyrophosphatase